MPRLPRWSAGVPAVLALAVGLASAGCSSSSSAPTTTAVRTPPTTGATTAPTAAPSSTTAPAVQSPSPAGMFGTKPTIAVPSGPPPTTLQSSDLIVGSGAPVKLGDKVTAQYVLATYSTRQEIQSSWGSGAFSFVLANGSVIDGWVKGVAGMRVGGRRELVIPPSLGYGSQSPGQGIAPNDTLVFIVDVVKVG